MQDAQGTRSTFLSWEGNSNSLASLVAELPEDKRSDYKAYRDGQQRCQGRGETKPGEEDHRRKGAPWRLLVTPLWEGLRALTPPAARHWTAPQPLTELQATLLTAVPAQARPDSPCPASGHRQRGTTPFPPEGWGGWLAGSRDDAPSSATSAGRGLSPARSPERRAGSGAPGLHVPCWDFFNKCMDKDLKLCSLQSYSGHLLNENGIFLGLYPARL